MQYGRFTFTCKLDDVAILPEFKGSTFRGVFGHALKNIVCALKSQDCGACLLRKKCIYAYVFDLPAEPSRTLKKRIAAPPHPYVLEFPDTRKTQFDKGEEFTFTLLLFGKRPELRRGCDKTRPVDA